MKYFLLLTFIASQSFAGGSATTTGVAVGGVVGAVSYGSYTAATAAAAASAASSAASVAATEAAMTATVGTDGFAAASAANLSAQSAADLAATTSSTGSGIMQKTCGSGPVGATMCAVGAALVVTAIANAIESDKNHNIANSLTPDGTATGSTPAYDAIKPYVSQANQIAAANGTTLGALASQAPASGTTASGSGGITGGSGQAGIGADSGLVGGANGDAGGAGDAASAKKSGYKVTAVGTEGGGGGGGNRGISGGGDMDINGLLASMKAGRNPASAGLQKSLNGTPIGVSNDNIFTKITQAYQAKTAAQTFLPAAH